MAKEYQANNNCQNSFLGQHKSDFFKIKTVSGDIINGKLVDSDLYTFRVQEYENGQPTSKEFMLFKSGIEYMKSDVVLISKELEDIHNSNIENKKITQKEKFNKFLDASKKKQAQEKTKEKIKEETEEKTEATEEENALLEELENELKDLDIEASDEEENEEVNEEKVETKEESPKEEKIAQTESEEKKLNTLNVFAKLAKE